MALKDFKLIVHPSKLKEFILKLFGIIHPAAVVAAAGQLSNTTAE
jgi:hypothetical protein